MNKILTCFANLKSQSLNNNSVECPFLGNDLPSHRRGFINLRLWIGILCVVNGPRFSYCLGVCGAKTTYSVSKENVPNEQLLIFYEEEKNFSCLFSFRSSCKSGEVIIHRRLANQILCEFCYFLALFTASSHDKKSRFVFRVKFPDNCGFNYIQNCKS